MTKDHRSDAQIDQIVDDLVKDEKTASALKDKLHKSMSAPTPHYAYRAAVEDDADDMWDNMPV